ncbi:hypothetical protein KZ813_04895 [Sphingomonas sp. RHCKR7]|uniref:hypothetical protein n=1 Tax=Sphingomonas folli TaxID=2862497 RepID=UPI001CA564F7|nr:hypothetical protein [Sphingomonas folli]MBW6526167.1 hypothetical protein [Sphingomonas folli]
MESLRHLIERRPAALALVLLLALALRLIVPAGFMPDSSARGLALVGCPEWGAAPGAMAHREGHDRADHRAPHRHTESTCAFAGLGLPTLAAGDPPSLALPTPDVAPAAAPRGRALRLAAGEWLRPPTHAPPARA